MSFQISLISHFFNEELLIGDWLDYHKQYFDYGILINHESTDRSVEIVKQRLPAGWLLVDTRLKNFDALANDEEVMSYERELQGFKLALNTTEYLFCPDFRERVFKLHQEHPGINAFGMRAASLVDRLPRQPIEYPIFRNRTWGFLNGGPGNPHLRHCRWIHNAPDGRYTPGRHDTYLPKMVVPDFLHIHLLFSPWPECQGRKLQIQKRIPDSDKKRGFGAQHLLDLRGLDQAYDEALLLSGELRADPVFNDCYQKLTG